MTKVIAEIVVIATLGVMIYSSVRLFINSLSGIITCFKNIGKKSDGLILKLVDYFTVFFFGCTTSFFAFLVAYFTIILIRILCDML